MVSSGEFFQKRTERRDAALNRQRILDAALMLFEQNGVEHVSMNQIATEAQIGPGTLYRRYKNKGELCLDLIKDNVVLLFEDIDAYLEENRDEAPTVRLKIVLSLFIRFRENKAQLLKGVEDLTPAASRRHITKSPIYNELHQILVNLFNEIFPTNVTKGDNVFRADMLLQALRSDSYLFQREVRGHSQEMILEQIYSTFICNE